MFSRATFSIATVLIISDSCIVLENPGQRESNDLREVLTESKDNQRIYQLTHTHNYVHQLNQLT